ncbi:Sas10 C-terminal domain-containing protein [Kickxella alabastrina]|uniref:Sas10 C-terminal domain-containing protein n=1 Tax=Kickxella alabastrina TaxID=61397 RepID=UPI0022207B1F|nr:Sas10 C-terminal domain-containing protein [Kickxella alabastrina]KAI7821145.1 Sas10 C-terminal domain-containing protein [Kickxella alabastrina]
MGGRSKKRSSKGGYKAPVDEESLIKKGASIKAIKTWNDVEHDSDEEFDASRDKVLLGFDKKMNKHSRKAGLSDEESDQEVFGVTAAGSSGEEDKDEDSAAADSDNFYSDEEDENKKKDSRFEDGAWGKQKHNYYDADDYGSNTDDDDEAFAEEAEEALRLQKKQMETLDEGDFIDEFSAQLGVSSKGDSSISRLVSSVDDTQAHLDMDSVALNNDGSYDISDAKRQALLSLPEAEKLKVIQAESPELLTLVDDMKTYWGIVRSEVRPVLDRAADLGYINNVAVYLVVKASTSEERGGIDLRDHPVISSIVEFRRRVEIMGALQKKLEPLLDIFAEDLASGIIGTGAEAKAQADAAAAASTAALAEESDVDMDDDVEQTTEEVAAALKASKARKSKSKSTSFLDVSSLLGKDASGGDSYAELQAMLKKDKASRRKQAQADTVSGWDAIEDGDFGEQDHLGEDDAEDKARAIRRLRHHAKRIAQAQTKRSFKNNLSGDMDVPYKNRRLDKLRLDDESVNAIKARADDFGDDLDMDDGEDDYYAQVVRGKQEQADAKEARRQEQWKMMVEANGEAKRNVNYQILKNKGLMPRRTKEQRNPRVKRRKRFEQAKKKISSAVTQVRTLEGNYGGEATGIKSGLSRSTRFK